MKPFNLELAKAGHPVRNAIGKDVRIICFDRKGSHPIVALTNAYGATYEEVASFTNEGFFFENEKESDADLFMKEEEEKLIPFDITRAFSGDEIRARNGKIVDEIDLEENGVRCAINLISSGGLQHDKIIFITNNYGKHKIDPEYDLFMMY